MTVTTRRAANAAVRRPGVPGRSAYGPGPVTVIGVRGPWAVMVTAAGASG